MIESQPYTITRSTHARLTGFYYLRTFWFVLVGPFLFGLGLILFGPNKVSQIFGLVLAAWPMTIFARAFLLHKKVHKAWEEATVMTVREDGFYFVSTGRKEGKYRLPFDRVRSIVHLADYQLIQTLNFGFVAVPNYALPDGTNLAQFIPRKGQVSKYFE